MREMGLRTVIYTVPDLEAGKRWYAQAFQTGPYFDDGSYVGFNIGGYELGLMAGEAASPDAPLNVRAYWGVEDMGAEVARLLALGAGQVEAPVNVGGPIVVAMLRDPWGNGLGLIHNPLFQAGQAAP